MKSALNKKPRVVLFTSKCERGLRYEDSLAIPLGLHVLKTYLEKNGAQCDVCDLELSAKVSSIKNPPISYLTEDDYVKRIEAGYYDVVGFSPTHWNMQIDLEFIYRLRRANKKSPKQSLFIGGGHSATISHKDWLEYGLDLVLLGHCELTLLKVLERFVENNNDCSCDIYRDIKGVAFIDSSGKLIKNNQPQQTPEEFQYSNYNIMLEMDAPYKEYWDLIRSRSSNVLTANKRSYVIENARLYTSNRCLARCGFCSCVGFLPTAHGQGRGTFIGLSAKQIHELILHKVKSYGARAFSFNDEDFLVGNNVGEARIMDLCKLIIESKNKGVIPEEVKFSCQTRAGNFVIRGKNGAPNTLNHKLVAAMKSAGFHNVSLGVESFSERLMKVPSINKAGMTAENCKIVLEGFFEHGLYVTINLILLIPESEPEDLLNTLYTAMEYIDQPVQISTSNVMRMFPGAPIYSSNDYTTIDVNMKNEMNGKNIRIPVYCEPQNEIMRGLLKVLETQEEHEVKLFKTEKGLDQNYMAPRVVISLCLFRLVAKYLKDEKLLRLVNNKLDTLVNANSRKRSQHFLHEGSGELRELPGL